jgi:Tfp pilus assembly protein PilX
MLVVGGVLLFRTAGVLLDWTLPVAILVTIDTGLVMSRVATLRRRRRDQEAERRRALERAQATEREDQLRETAKRAGESLAIALEAAQMGTWDCDLRTGGSERSRRHDEIFGCGSSVRWGRDAILARVS